MGKLSIFLESCRRQPAPGRLAEKPKSTRGRCLVHPLLRKGSLSHCLRGFLFCPFSVCFREKARCPVGGCCFCNHVLRTAGKYCLCMQHHRVSVKGSQTLKTKNKTTEASNLTFLHCVLGCAFRCCSDDRI